MKQPIVWTIAGSDASASAGIQTDLKVFEHLGAHGCSIITAITAQSNQEVNAIEYTSSDLIASQIKCLEKDFFPKAIKIGMLGNSSIIEKVRHYLDQYSGYVVLDPLITSTSGKNLFDTDLKNYISTLKTIFSLVDLITPNIREAEILSCLEIKSHDDIKKAALAILSLGIKSILIKAGHFSNDSFSQDYWTNGRESFWLSNKRYPTKNYRGTGCVLSSAISACLALGYNIKDAIVIAKMYVNRGIRLSKGVNSHFAMLFHEGFPIEQTDLPYLTHSPMHQLPDHFIGLGPQKLGLYPIVDSADWIKKLLALGIKTIQMRIKNTFGYELEKEIQKGIHLAKSYQARLFINDYWELAVRLGAYGIHLGQEDLRTADIHFIRKAGLRLGISTHCYSEAAHAHSFHPSYLALGPIFPTTSKIMSFEPLGLTELKKWRTLLNYPLVAIGGINIENLHSVLQTNVDGIAMISGITQSQDWIATTKKLQRMVMS